MYSQPVPRESPVAGWRPSLEKKKKRRAQTSFWKHRETGAGWRLSSRVILRDKNTPPLPAVLRADTPERLLVRKDTADQAGATSSALRPDGSQEVLNDGFSGSPRLWGWQDGGSGLGLAKANPTLKGDIGIPRPHGCISVPPLPEPSQCLGILDLPFCL